MFQLRPFSSLVLSLPATLLAVSFLIGCQGQSRQYPNAFQTPGNSRPGPVSVPVNQVLTPAGRQVELPGLRPQVVALSPDGQWLAVSGKTPELVLIDPETGVIRQRVPLPAEAARDGSPTSVSSNILKPDKDGQVSFTGLVLSPDGRRLYLSNVNGSIKVFDIGPDQQVTALHSLSLPKTGLPERQREIPAGLALSPDGRRLFVAGNLSNRLLELDAVSGRLLRAFDVGVAPFDVVLCGQKAYVSNWGGRRPDTQSVTGPAGQGTRVRVDPVRFIANEGTVSIVDLEQGSVTQEISTGLHASALALSPDARHLFVANAASDTVSVIDTSSDRVVETISLRWDAADPFGASPNALVMDPSGKTLFVCNGTQNAVAVVAFQPGQSKLAGMIPTDWYPGAITFDATRRALYVANIKGIGSGRHYGPGEKIKFNSHQYFGTLSLIPLPNDDQLKRHTRTVLANYQRARAQQAQLPPRPGRRPQPVPERAGEPSVFKHVVYVIKENRTYDQVLGDLKEGNGDRELCVFGEAITPNQHKIAREFVLLDNTCCSGILSADGHQWTGSAFATDYMEKSFAGFPRSYPDGMGDSEIDALAYSPKGFIWDNALAHGKTLRDYGEFTIGSTAWTNPAHTNALHFLDYYRDFIRQAGQISIGCRPAIDSLGPYICTNTIGWNMKVPDVFRAAQFIQELREFERLGELPNLIIICLPNDHTSGTQAGAPTPAAQVADNDLAFGQIIEAISHSRFWKETCILAIEDDPQNGWDHVTAYRTTAYVVSPYTRRQAVVHTPYNHTSLLRTMELILGLPPMNQLDATATPMSDCFTRKPDFTPYVALPNQIPLDQMNPEPRAIQDPLLRELAVASATLPLEEVDRCPEELLNRILWHAMKGSQAPYPGRIMK
jgi:YVTN family beta-propeller protein